MDLRNKAEAFMQLLKVILVCNATRKRIIILMSSASQCQLTAMCIYRFDVLCILNFFFFLDVVDLVSLSKGNTDSEVDRIKTNAWIEAYALW